VPPKLGGCRRSCNCRSWASFAGCRSLHRFRVGDYRVYFERHELGVLVHRILSRNTLKDFFYRSGLKVEEDEALQQNPKFWEMIEAARAPK
jgi:hypothetical protein